MSTLNVSNITDGTTTVGTSYVVNGSAKAWVNFNGTGTIAARDSFNVASLTDNGTGQYTVNFTNAFANADFATPMSAAPTISSGGIPRNGLTSTSTTSVSVRTTASTVFDDSTLIVVSVFGDLA